MKLSDLNADALEVTAKRTYEYEWPGARWANLSETEKATYRKEIGASIAVYLNALPTPTTSATAAEPS